MIRNKSKLDCF